MKPPIRHTPEGLLVTKGGVLLTAAIIGLSVTLLGFTLGAVRFFDKASTSVTRVEFRDYARNDSTIHAKQDQRDEVQDSLLREAIRDNTRLTCFVYKNPQPFCP